MLDVKKIRQEFDTVTQALQTRGVDPAVLEEFKTLDEERRRLLVQVEEKKKERNTVSEEIARLKKIRKTRKIRLIK